MGCRRDGILSQASGLNGTALYFHRVLATIVRLYTEAPVWPEAANEHIRVSLRKWVDFNRLFLRARGLDAEIVLRTDRAIIEADTDAASGQRPFAFHRVPFTAELIFGNGPNVPLHSGRLPKEGIANQVLGLQVGFTRAFREVARVSTHSQIIEVLLSEDNTDGLAGLFYIDFMEVWSRLDPWAVAVMGFFHKLPGPPVVGACPDCLPSASVSCGVGTFLQGNECLASPTECVELVSETFLTPEGTIGVRCVEER